ncbi:MAG: TrmH family RNA methyltransferase [Actinomycetota bacterium]
MEPIRSLRNRAVVDAARLHRTRERKETGLTLLEGPHLLEEALSAGITPECVFVLEGDPHRDWPGSLTVDERVMRRLAPTETPRGPIAVIRVPAWSPLPAGRHVLVLWGVSDPGNLGTIARSAAAFGLGVAVGPDSTDPWSPKALRAGAGAHFRLPGLVRVEKLDDLAGHHLAATVVSGGDDPAALGTGPWAFVLGPEAQGLDPDLVAACEVSVTIPMPGRVESLNLAVAASLLAYIVTVGSGGSPH